MPPVEPGYYEGLLQQGYAPPFVDSLRQTGETIEERQARTGTDLAAKTLGGQLGSSIAGAVDIFGRQAPMAISGGLDIPGLYGQASTNLATMSQALAAPTPGSAADIAARQATGAPPPAAAPAAAPAAPAASAAPTYDFGGIPTMEEGFGDLAVPNSTYYKVVQPNGRIMLTNVPQSAAQALGQPQMGGDIEGWAEGTQIQGPSTRDGGGMVFNTGVLGNGRGNVLPAGGEVAIGGRSLPGPDASRAEIEALSYEDQIRWAQRMKFARQKQNQAISDKLRDYNLQEATLPWEVRMQREAEKQAALYNYVKAMPEFEGLTEKIIDEKIEQLKMAEPERMKDPEKIQQAIQAIRPMAEQEAQKRIQDRLMMIMMGSSSVAGRYAANPMMAMMMGGMGMGMGSP